MVDQRSLRVHNRLLVLVRTGLTYCSFLVDGVTVAKSIQLKDKFENLGAKCISFVSDMSSKV